MSERQAIRVPGLVALLVLLAALGAGVWLIVLGAGSAGSASPLDPTGALARRANPAPIVLGAIVVVVAAAAASGFTIVVPNTSRVITFFGRYVGTIRVNGFHWTVPLTVKEYISLRVQNFDSQVLKVNDAAGNPIEIAAVIVWRVVDTAKAAFEVEDYEEFVKIQTETAVRHMAAEYPYDAYEDGVHSLRANADEVAASLHTELQQHLRQAGVEVMNTQLRRLAYAPEIAADMLRRQQAEAVVAARQRIVDGAVGMVHMALEALSRHHIVDLDEEKKAAMVSNLLVVLCSEHHAQPVVNTGSLYQ